MATIDVRRVRERPPRSKRDNSWSLQCEACGRWRRVLFVHESGALLCTPDKEVENIAA